MNITHPPVVFKDPRGEIIDLVDNFPFSYATVIHSAKGVERGNHYHKKTVQYVYLLTGKLRALSQMPGGEVKSAELNPGDLVMNEPNESHALISLEESTFLVLTSGERGGQNYENDTFRLEKPLSSLI
jgi:oxalate decarboxylase/phosphoglucose isomerase-like protein (cupin superfamily)